MTAQLVKLQSAPDLVERVYHALLDAISEGSLAPGARLTQEEIADAARRLAPAGAAGAAPAEEGRPRARRARPRRPRRAARPAWIAQVYEVRGALDGLAARLAAGRRAVLDPRARWSRPARGARPGHQGDDRRRHRVPQRDLRRLRQSADRRKRPRSLGAPAPGDGRGAAVGAASAKRCGTSTRRSPRPSPPATPSGPARLIDSTRAAPAKPAGAPGRRPDHRLPERPTHETHPRTARAVRPRRLPLLPRPVHARGDAGR